MNTRSYIQMSIVAAVGVVIVGCSGGGASPASLEDQAKMVRGSAPTKDQLDKAMKEYHGLGGAPPPKTSEGAPKH